MKFKTALLCVSALTGNFLFLSAQITVAPIPAVQAVQDVLVGSGVTTSNINAFTTNPNSIGVFDNGLQSNVGINRGIVLTSGLVTGTPLFSAPASQFKSGTNNGGTDPHLNTITPGTQDRAVLQFDFVPAGDTLKFRYVFASEEYPEFAPPNSSTFNDVFAFFLTGPNPAGPAYNFTNIALLPGTSTPVSINNVNAVTNSSFYIANNSQNFVFDGYTVVLTAIAPVVPCSTYTIKLAIADVGDTAFDSAVFLEENSFGTGAVTISPTYNYTNAVNDTLIYEGCSDVTISFFRDGVISQADTVALQISGTATNGVDYQWNGGPVPPQIIFAPGQSTFNMTITPIQDGISEPAETVTFTVTNINACGNVYTSSVTLTITNVDPLSVNAGPDRLVCPNVPQTLNGIISGGVPPYTSVWTQNNQPVGSNPLNVSPSNSGSFVITVTDGCTGAVATDTVNITVGPPQFNVVADIDSSSCFGTNDGSINITVTGQTPPFSYLWTPGNVTTQNLSDLAPGIYTLQVTDTFGCQITNTYQVFEPDNIPLNFTDRFICSGDSVNINPNPLPGTSYTWTPAEYFFGSNPNFPVLVADNPGPQVDTLFINVEATAPGACGRDDFRVFVTPLPKVQVLEAGYDSVALCPGDTILLNNSADNTGYPAITGTLWQNGATTASLEVTAPGTYWLQLTNQAGCKFRDSVEVFAVSPPEASIHPEFYICGNQSIILYGSNYLITDNLIWSTGETTDTISVSHPGTYYLYVSNECGTDTNMTEVIQIPIVDPTDLPNIFTPNGDGVNDIYSVPGLFTYSLKFNVKVYNRWGVKVFETEDKDINWAPKNLTDGVYFMTILYTDCNNQEKKLAHTITLVTE